MKLMYLVVRNLFHTYLQDKYLFILMIACTAVSTFGIYFYSYYLAGYYAAYDCEQYDTVQITNFDSASVEQMIQSIDHMDIDLIRDIYCKESLQKDNVSVMGEYHSDYASRLLSGTLFDMNEEDRMVIVDELTVAAMADEISFEDTPIGAEILINQIPYSIAGVCSITEFEEVIVPVKYFIRNYPMETMEIRFQERMDTEKKRVIGDLFDYADLAWSESQSIWESSGFIMKMLQISMIFLVILINTYMISYYVAKKQRDKFNKYFVCGAFEKQLHFISFLQIILQEIPGILLGIIIFGVVQYGIRNYHILYNGTSIGLAMFLFVITLAMHLLLSMVICRCSKGDLYGLD
ncbi:MAG: hypothetical protein K2J67_10245 [Lachnospiraceae bacterium]|nr:hypothetical protein [Lachnospiraceae bacterium]